MKKFLIYTIALFNLSACIEDKTRSDIPYQASPLTTTDIKFYNEFIGNCLDFQTDNDVLFHTKSIDNNIQLEIIKNPNKWNQPKPIIITRSVFGDTISKQPLFKNCCYNGTDTANNPRIVIKRNGTIITTEFRTIPALPGILSATSNKKENQLTINTSPTIALITKSTYDISFSGMITLLETTTSSS